MNYFEQGQVAVVTGAGSGIGRECARIFAREGARVVVSDVNEAGGHETVDLIRAAGGEAVFQRTDVSDPAAVAALIQFATTTYGGLHALVNNAGISGDSAPTADYPLEGWDRVIAINQNGVFYGMKYGIPAIIASGGGAIVNIASILGAVGFANAVAYVSAKHAVLGMTKVAALEYSAQGVRINAVGPAFIQTPLLSALDAMGEQVKAMIVGAHPIGRMGKPEEVGELVVWLASPRASFCTGAYYPVDGAYLAQ
ncbi:MAG: SDR family NAD(P)-dependent oxidoreductase [Candidatus Flexifilum sp.]|jgi:NAD(P)-dependent dehydrogenase (short-subunit alcohol dehydrogenase family)